MVQKQEIIISYYRQGQSQREIARTLRINRKTVKKYLTQYDSEKARSNLDQHGVIQAPQYNGSKRFKRKLTIEIQEIIDFYLSINVDKRNKGNAKQCMKAVDIHEELVKSGHQIGYSTICKYVKEQLSKGNEVFIRQRYAPGSCTEFDWAHVKLIIGGIQKSLMLAVFTLAHSNHRWAMLFYREDMSSFLQAHVEYLSSIEGVPNEIVYDNMKTAVARCTIRQVDKLPTDDLLKISAYYQFDFRFCNVAKGNEKGHVERSVEYVRRKAFCVNDQFDTLQQAQDHLQMKVERLNDKSSKGHSISINEMLKTEQDKMIALPVTSYDYAIIQHYRLDKYHTISIDTNHYSVPDSIHDAIVEVKKYPHQIVIYNKAHQKVATHQRIHAKHQWCINIDHYWQTMVAKPGALPHSEALHQAPPKVRLLFEKYYSDIPQVYIQLCLYCSTHLIEVQVLIQATLLTYKQGPHNPLSFDKVKWNMINLNNDHSQPLDNVSTHESSDNMSDLITQQCEKQLNEIQASF